MPPNGIGQEGEGERTLRVRIEQLERNLETLQNDLKAERSNTGRSNTGRSNSFWSREFGRPTTEEPVEGMRERIRGLIAMALIVTLILVVLATLGYFVWLSLNLDQVSTDDLNTGCSTS